MALNWRSKRSTMFQTATHAFPVTNSEEVTGKPLRKTTCKKHMAVGRRDKSLASIFACGVGSSVCQLCAQPFGIPAKNTQRKKTKNCFSPHYGMVMTPPGPGPGPHLLLWYGQAQSIANRANWCWIGVENVLRPREPIDFLHVSIQGVFDWLYFHGKQMDNQSSARLNNIHALKQIAFQRNHLMLCMQEANIHSISMENTHFL